ncbi:MAG TPA: Ig-like domain-containing protein [Chloroflexota bacterium]|nr:Ig-like domain-containing protein [Chloroflexota bacterium]
MRRSMFRAILVAFTLLALPIASIGAGNRPSAHAAPAQISGRASSLTDFNTTLSGPTSDGKHMVSINVDWAQIESSHVNVEISVGKGTSLQSGITGSTYNFTLPVRDFQLGQGTASLDTHKDLGAYGHVSANWTFVTKNEATTLGCFGSSNTQHLIASGSATFTLSFPCDGSFTGKLSGTNLDSDVVAPSNSSNNGKNSSFNGLAGIYFSAASAQKSIKSGDLAVGAYTFGNLGSFIYVSLGAGNVGNSGSVGGNGLTAAEFGLTQYSHFASDKLSSGAFTSSATGASLTYSGVLGKAKISWKGTGSPFSISMVGHCLSSSLPSSQANSTVVMSSQEASVSGSAKVTACATERVTFASGDTGALINTHKGAASAPSTGAGAAGGTGSGPSISGGSFSVSSATPANGATGVSTTAAISVTFSGAPGKVVEIILTEANNPAGIVMLPPPTVNGNTITSTPPTPLKPNTEYKETVVAQGAAGGFVNYTATFTTGS